MDGTRREIGKLKAPFSRGPLILFWFSMDCCGRNLPDGWNAEEHLEMVEVVSEFKTECNGYFELIYTVVVENMGVSRAS